MKRILSDRCVICGHATKFRGSATPLKILRMHVHESRCRDTHVGLKTRMTDLVLVH
jgi:hypothetical protein